METPEIERELEELETRIERLRALYEQHFMGLEKLEPYGAAHLGVDLASLVEPTKKNLVLAETAERQGAAAELRAPEIAFCGARGA